MLETTRSRLSRATVLIVDDAPECRRAERELLETRGYAVVGEAGSAAQAIALVGRLAPNAVLLDVRLPDANGFELAAHWTRARPALAVLLTSVNSGLGFYALARRSGARGFVPKDQLALVDLTSFWPTGSRP